jgi:Family of unknown function (DUF695)
MIMSTPPVNNTWSVGRGDNNGRPLFIRINTGLRDTAGKPPFDHRFEVAVPLHSPDANGLPIATESEELKRIEDSLLVTFEPSKHTILAVVLTTSGFREFVFYTSAARDIIPAMEHFKTQFKTHELQFYVQPDPDWKVYKSFLF